MIARLIAALRGHIEALRADLRERQALRAELAAVRADIDRATRQRDALEAAMRQQRALRRR